jgi:membrane protein DedA with SNARE-associated domain
VTASILFGLVAGTFVSEDLTSIGAGVLARDGVVGLAPAIAACAAGVYIGDLGLWGLGRLSQRRVLRWTWVTRHINPAMLVSLGAHLDDHLAVAVLGSRFLPGSRLPMYLALGLSGRRPVAFAVWSLVAVLLWTPVLVWLTKAFGADISMSIIGDLNGVLRYVLPPVVICIAYRLTVRIVSGGFSSLP